VVFVAEETKPAVDDTKDADEVCKLVSNSEITVKARVELIEGIVVELEL